MKHFMFKDKATYLVLLACGGLLGFGAGVDSYSQKLLAVKNGSCRMLLSYSLKAESDSPETLSSPLPGATLRDPPSFPIREWNFCRGKSTNIDPLCLLSTLEGHTVFQKHRRLMELTASALSKLDLSAFLTKPPK
jgi:hypothetical protein